MQVFKKIEICYITHKTKELSRGGIDIIDNEKQEMNEEEMEQVSGGRKYIVYDENGKEVRRTLSEADVSFQIRLRVKYGRF